MREKTEKTYCPCCGYKTLSKGERGFYDICPVCFWEYDGERQPDSYSPCNHMTLEQARENFRAYGACDEKSKGLVRRAKADEM